MHPHLLSIALINAAAPAVAGAAAGVCPVDFNTGTPTSGRFFRRSALHNALVGPPRGAIFMHMQAACMHMCGAEVNRNAAFLFVRIIFLFKNATCMHVVAAQLHRNAACMSVRITFTCVVAAFMHMVAAQPDRNTA
ncbi:MAG: hypothetical protein IPN85_05095 [Flavobacteriales bacterium]|nr:hypothetical protein [Flavobacteriales bacterium]